MSSQRIIRSIASLERVMGAPVRVDEGIGSA
jgi:hypothetical protein